MTFIFPYNYISILTNFYINTMEDKMLIELMKVLWNFYIWTWFIWPFVFVFSFSHGLAQLIKDGSSSGNTFIIVAAISFLIILAGVVAPTL